jgi:hypothetical protein
MVMLSCDGDLQIGGAGFVAIDRKSMDARHV